MSIQTLIAELGKNSLDIDWVGQRKNAIIEYGIEHGGEAAEHLLQALEQNRLTAETVRSLLRDILGGLAARQKPEQQREAAQALERRLRSGNKEHVRPLVMQLLGLCASPYCSA